jgi:hypothetical protein
MADPNPLAGMPLAESLANNMNESLQWMSRMWGNSAAAPLPGAEALFGQSPSVPGLPSMLMPTLDPKELEKRIGDLKTVEHWLDMNRALLHTTIQTLEMQRNAVIALQSMAMSTQAGRPVPGSASTGSAPDAAATAGSDSGAGGQPLPFNPAQWWNALHEQFARVASAAATEAERAAADPQSAREAEAPPPRGPAETPPAPKAGRKPSAG